MTDTARAWVDVDLGALVTNYETFQERAGPRVGMLPVVKANAYGLGVEAVIGALEPLEPWGYAVAALAEGVELRRVGVDRPVLCLFPTPEELDGSIEAAVTPAIGDRAALERWRALAGRVGRRLPFHLEVDTGMGRSGFAHDAADRWLPTVLDAAAGELIWEGTFTHFHSADAPDAAPSEEQWRRFRSCLERMPEGAAGLIHSAASAVGVRWPEFGADLARPGLFLYGASELDGSGPTQPRPVVTVRARAMAVRDVPEGWTASYGATHRAPRPSRWATLAVGYGDGLRRELSNDGVVRFDAGDAPIIGRVCMDVTIADVTDLTGVAAGAVATVIGGPQEAPMSLRSVADRCGTITYEILTGLTDRLPRRYHGRGGTTRGP